jgi:hypothetical protein
MLRPPHILLLKTLLLGTLATVAFVHPVVAAASSTPSGAKTNAPAAASGASVEITIPKSRFAPSTEGGKDPFFPNSARLERKIPATQTNKVVAVVPELRINGFSGNAARPLVIINNLTFGVGDEQMVTTAAGRAQVRCVEIRTEDQAVVIEMNGQRRELKFLDRK